ncbi:MAG: ActS/PrrB/RegB family redox-sensitive histidine kinase [Bradyrhizobiaceae bacterium]|nr:ActS/PrrB/RegB family redox-sensitive histidine kinase [Bradyrhizobiaceae bacterium]
MSEVFDEQTPQTLRHLLRLDTLVRLRWLAVLGQTAAVLVVYDGFDFEVPFWACLAVIAAYAAVNVALRLRFRGNQRLEPHQAARLLALDIIELAVLLFLTGGLKNPFAFLLAGPVLVSAAALPKRMTLILGGLVFVCATVLVLVHYPLPWPEEEPIDIPQLYMIGVWLSLMLAIGYISIYAAQITEESRQLSEGLAATELVLAREHYLTQLDGLAAAAAHELGTPLSTILVVARELERDTEPESRFAEDIRLLREQAQRCRVILGKLTELPAPGEPFERMKLSALIEEVVAPHRGAGVAIDVAIARDDPNEPVGARNPAVLYGLGNILENAVDFARDRVEVKAGWTDENVEVEVSDDGSGFPPEIIDRMGEPYVTSERGRRMRGREMPGLGLGFFIAKTLLARSGAKISLKNKQFPQRGAIVRVRWNRDDFERPLISPPPDDALLAEGGEQVASSQPSVAPTEGADKSETPPLAEIH